MDRTRLSQINNRIAIQGKLTPKNLIELQNIGIDLSKYVDRDEVSKGNVSYNKYLSSMRVRGL